jgi:uncharacterized protein (TIGR02118 family)
MADVKLVVLYPTPRDSVAFERAYREEHAPMVTPENFPGLQQFVASKITGAADGGPAPFARIGELYFPSVRALQAAAAGEPAKRVVAHAIAISSGGPPLFLLAEGETTTF